MDGCPERALDTHIYQAWRNPDSRLGFYSDACRQKSIIATMEREFGPVIVGEWSLATDNCTLCVRRISTSLLLSGGYWSRPRLSLIRSFRIPSLNFCRRDVVKRIQ